MSLAMLVKNVAIRSGFRKISFSGGVFQNAFLVDLVIELLQNKFELYFHKQLSPNDECIGFGQLAYETLQSENKTGLKEELQITNH